MAGHGVCEIGDETFDREIVASHLPTLVDFYGQSCGPCKAIEPILENIATNYRGRLRVAKVNVNSSPQAASRFMVKSLPTLLLFRGGKVLDQFVSSPSLPALDKFIQKVL
jgi:thioredoxin 1